MKKRILIALVALGSLICPALAQEAAVKTNLLYDAAKILIPMIVKMGYDEKMITIELKNEDFYNHRVTET